MVVHPLGSLPLNPLTELHTLWKALVSTEVDGSKQLGHNLQAAQLQQLHKPNFSSGDWATSQKSIRNIRFTHTIGNCWFEAQKNVPCMAQDIKGPILASNGVDFRKNIEGWPQTTKMVSQTYSTKKNYTCGLWVEMCISIGQCWLVFASIQLAKTMKNLVPRGCVHQVWQ